MNNIAKILASTGIGAGLMYLLDPDKGRRRRALLHDKWMRAVNKGADAIEVTARDIQNRSYGMLAESRRLLASNEVNGQSVEERVRAEIGRIVSHPHAIRTAVDGGKLVLSGPVLEREVDALLARVSSVPGVMQIDNQLEVHKTPGNISALQGAPARRSSRRMGVLQTNWSPALRFFSGIAGASLMLYGTRHRGLRAALASAAGAGLFARGVSNKDLKRVFGMGAGANAVAVKKTIHINAPVERVFELWSDYENFPRFMSNVREVRRGAGNKSHWVVTGPAGMPVEWDAVLTKTVPNQEIAWRTEPGSAVEHAGRVRFARANGNATLVDVELTYNPGIGALGHGVAVLFGADPKTEMDADLMRMKSYIETGHLPRDASRH